MKTMSRMLSIIALYRQNHPYGPSTREIADALGLASTSSIEYHLFRLHERGWVTWGTDDNGRRLARTVALTDEGELVRKENIHE